MLNAPQPWWCQPEAATPGSTIRIFGHNLSQRPDFARALVCLTPAKADDANLPAKKPGPDAGAPVIWLKVVQAGKYQIHAELPKSLEAGRYQIWIHAGNGGEYGWSEPLALAVHGGPPPAPGGIIALRDGDVQQAADRLAAAGGGTIKLAEGFFDLSGTLIVPANVRIEGAGAEKTFLVSPSDPGVSLATISSSGWNQGPSAVHSQGDRMIYKVQFPAAGAWHVWLRYATQMSAYHQPGVSKNMVLSVDDGEEVPLDNLPNTGSFARSSGAVRHDSDAGRRAPGRLEERQGWRDSHRRAGILAGSELYAHGRSFAHRQPADHRGAGREHVPLRDEGGNAARHGNARRYGLQAMARPSRI